MREPTSSSAQRLLALAASCVVAAGFAACGSDDDGSTNADRNAPARTAAATPAQPAGEGSEERRVTATVEQMYDDLAARDAAGVCTVMSKDARDRIAQQPPGGSTVAPADRTCEASMSGFFDAAARTGILERAMNLEVQDVSIDGSTAAVTVSAGGQSGKVALRREGGDWRFGPGAVAP